MALTASGCRWGPTQLFFAAGKAANLRSTQASAQSFPSLEVLDKVGFRAASQNLVCIAGHHSPSGL